MRLLLISGLLAFQFQIGLQEEQEEFCSAKSQSCENLFLNDGDWRTDLDDILVPVGPCHLPIEDAALLTKETFLKKYAYKQPFVLRDGQNNDKFKAMCDKNRLLKRYGKSVVKLSSANSFSYEKREVEFANYVANIKPQKKETLANETFYFFGDNDHVAWAELLDAYKQPPLTLPAHTAALSFGVAGAGTGVPFHFHGPGFAEPIYGRKRWFLTHPDIRPEFHPNKTTLQWFNEDYDRVIKDTDVLECTIKPGEAIYFPDKWWHATLNIDTSVFISTFLSP